VSDLIVIGYDNPQTARQAYEQVQRLQQDFVVELRGLAIVDVDADGKTHVDTPQRIIGRSAAHGALFGLLSEHPHEPVGRMAGAFRGPTRLLWWQQPPSKAQDLDELVEHAAVGDAPSVAAQRVGVVALREQAANWSHGVPGCRMAGQARVTSSGRGGHMPRIQASSCLHQQLRTPASRPLAQPLSRDLSTRPGVTLGCGDDGRLRYRTPPARLRLGGGAEPSQAGPRSPARAAAARSAPRTTSCAAKSRTVRIASSE
jgi:hypothetical protein